MALVAPTLVGAWHTRGEVPFPDTANLQAVQRSWFWVIGGLLLNTNSTGTTGGASRVAGMNWSLVGSSNGTTAGIDGTDRINFSVYTPANLVRAASGTAHSWFVVQNGSVYYCFDYNGAVEGSGSIIYSRTAFTGGSVTNRPTSTTEIVLLAATALMGVESIFSVNYRAWISLLGTEFHFGTYRLGAGVFNSHVFHRLLTEQHISDLWPSIGAASFTVSTPRGAPAISGWNTIPKLRTYDNVAVSGTGGIEDPYFGSSQWISASQVDKLASNWKGVVPRVWTLDAGKEAYRGYIQDLYLIGAASPGAPWPTAVGQQYIVSGAILAPCVGVNPSM